MATFEVRDGKVAVTESKEVELSYEQLKGQITGLENKIANVEANKTALEAEKTALEAILADSAVAALKPAEPTK